MSTSDTIVFFHAPNTRSSGARILLEELAAPHELRVVNMKAGEQRKPAFLAVNPMGKVPAILHRGALVTEQAAIFIYLADLFPKAGLAPATDDRLRGPYLAGATLMLAVALPTLAASRIRGRPAICRRR